MQTVNFFDRPDRAALTEKIEQGDWGAAKLLAKLLRSGSFFTTLGEGGKLFLLLEGENIVSFLTLTPKDCVDDETLYPWIGFVYTFPQYRGNRHIGKLLAHAVADAKKQGFERVYLATDHIGLYEKYGFTYMESRMDIYGEESRIYTKG